MNEYQKLADSIRCAARSPLYATTSSGLLKGIADRLDALASAEPVLWRAGACTFDNKSEALEFLTTSMLGYQIEPLYALPKPPSVSRDALRKALDENYSPDVTPEDIAEMAMVSLGIEVSP